MPESMKSQKPARFDPDKRFLVEDNSLTLLIEGRQRLAALIDLIDSAKTSLRLLYYISPPDGAGQQLRAAMERAIDRGVHQNVYPTIGCFASSSSSNCSSGPRAR